MKNVAKVALAAVAVAAVVAACSDHPDAGMGTGTRLRGHHGAITMGTCTTISALNALAVQVFGAGSPNVNAVLGKLDNLKKKVQQGDAAGAAAQANNIVTFVRDKAAQGGLAGTEAQIAAFISGTLCYAGVSPDTFLILPTDDPQDHTSSDGESGIHLDGNTVTEPTLLTIESLDDTADVLDTPLDKYPHNINIHVSSNLTKPAVVAVCPPDNVDPAVRARLRLGHQTGAGFVITPSADASFLRCDGSTAQASKLPAWVQKLASAVLPTKLYAAPRMFEVVGIGGSATEFSPFGAVDPELGFSGGVGGSATEFIRLPDNGLPNAPRRRFTAPRTANIVINGQCVEASATVGTGLETECRPAVTVTTHLGTPIPNVSIAWDVESGGGSIAPNDISANTCGTLDNVASTQTNVNGKARICWQLGPTGGTNKTKATPDATGLPDGVTFDPPALFFTATALKITPTVSATGGTFDFNNAARTGSGTCSDGLTPVLTYSGGAAPVNVGTYTLTVTCGTGSLVYNEVSTTAQITINAVAPTINVTCPVSVVYTGSAQTPCSATATAPGLSTTATVTYQNNTDVGTATANGSYPAGGNYLLGTGSKTFAITAAPTSISFNCPASVPYTGTARTPCTASVSGLNNFSAPVTPTYSNNVNAGTANVYGAFTAAGNYQGSTGSTTFQITKLTATATSGNATINFGSPVPSISCNVTGLLPADAGTVTCTTSVPAITVAGTYATTPVVSPATPTNYTVNKVTGILTVVGYVQNNCFASPIYNVMPDTKSAQKKGSNLPIKCTLTTPQGAAVTTATGNVLVVDRGTTGTATPVTVFQGTNVFKFSTGGNYAYGLDTSPAGFVAGHYYYVTATWNDGSQTNGYFLLK
ncbi:MAG TPA: hypothetical protein VE967_13295 [Gemmatimonadaceae bacterium]|nr:hypothetical protein [Gemmatimonadaceae bacterium]